MKVDIVNYITKPLIGGSLLIMYDVFVEKRNVTDSETMYDAGLFGLSILASKIADDVLQNNVNLKQYSVVGFVLEPIITGFIYTYLYDNVYVSNFKQRSNRAFTENFLISTGLSVLTSYIHNPLISLITGMKMY